MESRHDSSERSGRAMHIIEEEEHKAAQRNFFIEHIRNSNGDSDLHTRSEH
jgi:hypothetical protein